MTEENIQNTKCLVHALLWNRLIIQYWTFMELWCQIDSGTYFDMTIIKPAYDLFIRYPSQSSILPSLWLSTSLHIIPHSPPPSFHLYLYPHSYESPDKRQSLGIIELDWVHIWTKSCLHIQGCHFAMRLRHVQKTRFISNLTRIVKWCKNLNEMKPHTEIRNSISSAPPQGSQV